MHKIDWLIGKYNQRIENEEESYPHLSTMKSGQNRIKIRLCTELYTFSTKMWIKLKWIRTVKFENVFCY